MSADCGTLTDPFKHDIRSSIVSVQNLEDSNMKTVILIFMELIRDLEESLSRPGGVRGRGNRLYLACFSSLRPLILRFAGKICLRYCCLIRIPIAARHYENMWQNK